MKDKETARESGGASWEGLYKSTTKGTDLESSLAISKGTGEAVVVFGRGMPR